MEKKKLMRKFAKTEKSMAKLYNRECGPTGRNENCSCKQGECFMKKKLIRKNNAEKKQIVTLYNIECSSSGGNTRCQPGC